MLNHRIVLFLLFLSPCCRGIVVGVDWSFVVVIELNDNDKSSFWSPCCRVIVNDVGWTFGIVSDAMDAEFGIFTALIFLIFPI